MEEETIKILDELLQSDLVQEYLVTDFIKRNITMNISHKDYGEIEITLQLNGYKINSARFKTINYGGDRPSIR